MKSNFNTSKWFKNQYLYEGMSDEEIQTIKRYEELTDDDKLKLAKIQAMMDRERALREDDTEVMSDKEALQKHVTHMLIWPHMDPCGDLLLVDKIK